MFKEVLIFLILPVLQHFVVSHLLAYLCLKCLLCLLKHGDMSQ